MPFKEILDHINDHTEQTDPSPVIQLISETGIHEKNNIPQVENKIRVLTALLNDQPELAQALGKYLIRLFDQYDPFTLYTDAGILPGHGLFSEAYKRLKYKVLPPVQDASQTQYLIGKVFTNKHDHLILAGLGESVWLPLLNAIPVDADVLRWKQENLHILLNALLVLSQRITAIGLEPEVMNKLPGIVDLQSPFFGLYREVQHYVDCFKLDVAYINTNEVDYNHILVMCTQCSESINELHKHKDKYGISLHLAFLMLRLEQHVSRLTTILKLVQIREKTAFNKTLFGFLVEVVYAENKKYSVSKHLNDNLSLIAYKITEHTSKAGEHYRTVNRKEYYAMFRAAMGGGIIVAFIVLFKVLAHHLNLAPFGEAFVNSMIYACGFIAIHLCHFTLATKQPAMTANTIAASMDDTDMADRHMLKTVRLIAEISRAQFVSLAGNILLVLPAAYLLGLAYFYVTGNPVLSTTEAESMIMNLHPWFTASLFYAAIAGVFLMASGMIAGYYDNKVVYGKIPERIRQHPFLKKVMSKKLLYKISVYLENNSGILFGNLFLGFFLGTAPLLGRFFGLPIDVRHVTLSTGNFGMALQALDRDIPTGLCIVICISLLLMGLINLLVSFGLAIFVAVRSRSLHVTRLQSVRKAISLYFRAKPLDFFVPPREGRSEKAAE